MNREISYKKLEYGHSILFDAMASPCELLIENCDYALASCLGEQVAQETWRIQDKFSRYQDTSIVSYLNRNAGSTSHIDEETFALLSFAQQCYQISEGDFDITSGILRNAWTFDGSDNIPTQTEIDQLIPLIGFHQVQLDDKHFKMNKGMEIDLGGLGKEYAVDRAIDIIRQQTSSAVLVNFGGDIAVNGARANNTPWQVGIEHPSFSQSPVVQIKKGAIATSGDANRYLVNNGKRYSHILNTQTGWPVEDPPHAITVAAPTCIQAGFLATLALLQGKNAEALLDQQNITYWVAR